MQIIPAIDIFQGQCVRLTEGLFTRKTDYGITPSEVADRFLKEGAEYLHVVDLEGAKEGKVINWKSIESVARFAGRRMEIGGGIRTDEEVERLLVLDIDRIVIGSVALQSPNILSAWVKRFGSERFAVALDIRDGIIAYAGWQQTGKDTISDVAGELIKTGIGTFLSTDITRDGRLAGPNLALYDKLVKEFPEADWIASGGVRGRGDVEALRDTGVAGVVIGKALYEGTLRLEEVLRK